MDMSFLLYRNPETQYFYFGLGILIHSQSALHQTVKTVYLDKQDLQPQLSFS